MKKSTLKFHVIFITMILMSYTLVFTGNNFDKLDFFRLIRALSSLIIALLIILLPVYFYFDDLKKLFSQTENKDLNKPLLYNRLIAIFGLTLAYFGVFYYTRISFFDLKFDNLILDFFHFFLPYFCIIGIIIFVGYIIWSKDFEEKFPLKRKNDFTLVGVDQKANSYFFQNILPLYKDTPNENRCIQIGIYQDINSDTLENIIQSNEDKLDESELIPIKREEIHSDTPTVPLNGDKLNENTKSLLKLKVFSDEEIEELISKIIDKIHPSSIDDLKTFLKGGKPLNKMKWVSLGSRSRGIKYIDLFYFLHPIIDSELKTFDGEERKTLIKLITENFVTYHKEITKEIDFKNANNRYTDYINEH